MANERLVLAMSGPVTSIRPPSHLCVPHFTTFSTAGFSKSRSFSSMSTDRSESPTDNSSNKRKRSRAGCYTCRRRKKACDSARPVCGSCTRLAIPCVFPKLHRNAKGELVPSPQPNGRTKKLHREDSPIDGSVSQPSPTLEDSWMPTSAVAPPWSLPSTSTNPVEDVEEDAETALDSFLASLGDTESGQAWAWPLFNDTPGMGLDIQSQPTIQGSIVSTAVQSADVSSDTAPIANPMFMSNKMVTAAAVLDHVPALFEYFVNSFSHVLSVLGPGHNPVLTTLLPVVNRSPLVMCALIAWAATHRANIGHPYEDVAKVSTDTVEIQVDQLDIDRHLTAEEQEEYMWTLLILGGVEIVRGDVRGWISRLPMTRRLLKKAIDSIDFKTSPTWQSLAYNCAYHDVLSSLTTTKSPDMPEGLYEEILYVGDIEMDSYMGATMQIFGFLIDISKLAGEVYGVLCEPESEERSRRLIDYVAKHDTILGRLRHADIPLGLFVRPLPMGTDRSHLIVAFETYRVAAELYLRQAVLRSASSDLQCRTLASRIMHNLRFILSTPNESQMMFPLFVAGVGTVHEAGRTEIMGIFNKFSERVQVRNVITVFNLLLEVWKRDPEGDRFVDWRKLAEESGVAISFG